MNNAPLATSGQGSASWSAGRLTLAPDLSGGTAWAIFGLSGFPVDGSIFPQRIAGADGALWVGLSHYATGRWEWHEIRTDAAWTRPYGPSTGYVSAGGASYVAIVRQGLFSHTYDELTLTASDSLFAPPVADIQLESAQPTAEWEVRFDFSGSAAGDGNVTSVLFTPELGAPPVELGPGLPPAVYGHSYAASGLKHATLEIYDDTGGSDTADLQFTVAEPVRELLAVYNSSIPQSAELALYYMSPETGRAIDPDYALGLPLGAAVGPEISRATYETTIRDAIKSFLDDPGNAEQRGSIKYLLLFKGLPHRISGFEAFSGTLNDTTCSAVDSELCTLYSDKPDGDATGYPNQGALWNAAGFANFGSAGFYMGYSALPDYSFAPQAFQVSDDTGKRYPLDYLVGRITGWTYAEATASIDRSLAADTSGTGWVVFDHTPLRNGQDSMVDPVYVVGPTPIPDSGYDLLLAASYNVFADATSSTIVAGDPLLPLNFTNSVIGYAGWGENHEGEGYPHGPEYILLDAGWNYLPGACWIAYESFNGSDNDDSDGIQRRNQGQVMDFIRMGGTCATGNAFEPYAIATGDERVVFYRYLVKGERWIEAAYKGLRLLSWQEIVVGDPLCRVRP